MNLQSQGCTVAGKWEQISGIETVTGGDLLNLDGFYMNYWNFSAFWCRFVTLRVQDSCLKILLSCSRLRRPWTMSKTSCASVRPRHPVTNAAVRIPLTLWRVAI